MVVPPLEPGDARGIRLARGPNITGLPDFEPLPDALELPVLLKVGDDVSTDEITPAGNAASLYSSLDGLSPHTVCSAGSAPAPRQLLRVTPRRRQNDLRPRRAVLAVGRPCGRRCGSARRSTRQEAQGGVRDQAGSPDGNE
jgi:hypothetical protein